MASDLYNTIDALSREKGIDPQIVVSAVEDAIVVATRKYYKTQENLRAELDKETGKIRAFAVKTIVETPEQVEDPVLQVTLDDARKINPDVELGASSRLRSRPKAFSDASRRNWPSRSSFRRCGKLSATPCTTSTSVASVRS